MRLILITLLLTTACAKAPKDSSPISEQALDVAKMSCAQVGAEIHCQGLDANDPNGIPNSCKYYAKGHRQFLNGELATSEAYDCGYHYGGLRCFYFVHEPDAQWPAVIEDIVCQPDHS